MQSVAMISYSFPPEGRAGVYRPLRFVRQLSSLGWDTTVITADPYRYERFDPKLLVQVPKDTEVIAVKAHDPWQAFQSRRGKKLEKQLSEAPQAMIERVHVAQQVPLRARFRKYIRMAEAYYYYPDFAKPWIGPAVRATARMCAAKYPMVLWATIGPVSAGVVAQRVSHQTNIPYVLDFRDPWELYYYESEILRPKSVTRSTQRLLYRLFQQARSVVFLFPRMAECYCQAYRGALDPAKIHIIPNGYEGDLEEFQIPDADQCTVVYTGTVSSYRYDTLLEAIGYLKRCEPTVAGQLRFSFVGDGMALLARAVESRGISDVVHVSPPVPYDEVKRVIQTAHGLLILGRSQDRKGHELVAGAKLFGYFKARKPIVGILPQDETREILSTVGVETIADSQSVQDVVRVLKRMHACWAEGRLATLLPHIQACQRFGAEPQTAALIRALEGHPPEEPFVPGKVDIPASLREMIDNEWLWYRPVAGDLAWQQS